MHSRIVGTGGYLPAQILTNANVFRFDGSDLMPEQINEAFLQGVITYTRDPSTLDSVLANLDVVTRNGLTGSNH